MLNDADTHKEHRQKPYQIHAPPINARPNHVFYHTVRPKASIARHRFLVQPVQPNP